MSTLSLSRPALGTAEASLLVAPAIPDQLHSLYTNFLLLQASVVVIETQPTFDLSLVQTLPQDQALLLTHIHDYRNGLAAQLLAVFQSFVTLGEKMGHFGSQLLDLAGQLDAVGPGLPLDGPVLTQFDKLLLYLQNTITAPDASSGSTYYAVRQTQQAASDFYNYKTEIDQANFAATVQAVATSGPIKQLIAQLASLQGQINSMNATIAKGATDQILEVIGFAFAIGAAAMGDVAALPIAVNVAIAVSDEAQSASGHAAEWKANYEQLHSLIANYVATAEALISDEQQYAVLQTLAGQSTGFAQHLTAANTALQGVTGALSTLANGFGLLRATDVAPSTDYFTGQVQASLDFWAGVGQSCTTWLTAAATL